MKYIPHPDDEVVTTLRIPKRIRRKLGLLINKNENLDVGLERILDQHVEKLPEP